MLLACACCIPIHGCLYINVSNTSHDVLRYKEFKYIHTRGCKCIMHKMTYPTDAFAGWTDQGAHNVIVDVGIVDVKGNLQQD